MPRKKQKQARTPKKTRNWIANGKIKEDRLSTVQYCLHQIQIGSSEREATMIAMIPRSTRSDRKKMNVIVPYHIVYTHEDGRKIEKIINIPIKLAIRRAILHTKILAREAMHDKLKEKYREAIKMVLQTEEKYKNNDAGVIVPIHFGNNQVSQFIDPSLFDEDNQPEIDYDDEEDFDGII